MPETTPVTVAGYECPYTGNLYLPSELVGMGNPPRSPHVPPGQGQGVPMAGARIKIAADGKRTKQ